VVARFIDRTGEHVTPDRCDDVFVASAHGMTTAMDETLEEGDVLFVRWPEPFDIKPQNLALFARAPRSPCASADRPAVEKHVVRASLAPELAWAGGAMKAHLDVEKDLSPAAYFGRLEGTAPVAEHTHPTSWEILAAVDGSGTFTVAGKPEHLGAQSITAIAPNTTHSWRPDPGTKLVAFQLYVPPGPEQRFRSLAAGAQEAGAK
jgi:mannose-6-phosphate isomerase-like protein (cupin superfamily)